MFETQRLANQFPMNTKLREDASSLGFKFLSIIGDINAQSRKDLIRFKKSYYPKTSLTDLSVKLYEWEIDSFIFQYEDAFQMNTVLEPTVTGDTIPLENIEDIETMSFRLPSRITESTTYLSYSGEIYSSNINSSSSIADIEVPSNLYVEFRDIDSFSIAQTTTSLRSALLVAQIMLRGEDLYGNEILETIFPSANGTYKTKNIFAKLLDFTLINVVGADGIIKIKNFDFDLSQYVSSYSTYVDIDSETNLLVEFDSDFIYLRKFIFPVYEGKRAAEDKETFTGMKVSDAEGNLIKIEDISFIPSTETLVVLSSDALYFIENYLPPIMDETSEERTLEISLTVEAPVRYPIINEELKFYLYQRSILNRMKTYVVRLIDPTGEEFYLNENDEFTTSPWTFTASNTDWPGDSVVDRWITLELDSFGQWDLIIETVDVDDVSAKEVSSFYVPLLVADKKISLSKEFISVSYHQDGKIYLSDGTDTTSFIPLFDYYFLDSTNHRVYTIEHYSTLDIDYE